MPDGKAGGSPLPRSLHPQSIPVVGCDDHLPPVAAARLTPAPLRARFAAPQPFAPEFEGDGRFIVDRVPASAAVLVGIVDRPGPEGPTVLLTQRTAHLRDHAGQISFPGGRVEDDDADVVAAALREAREEIGLDPARVEVLGQLPVYVTVTHFVVTPVVGIVAPPFELAIDPSEVASAFEVPLAFLMTPAHHRRHVWTHDDGERSFLSMPWQDRFVWGATAAMLRNLYRFLAA